MRVLPQGGIEGQMALLVGERKCKPRQKWWLTMDYGFPSENIYKARADGRLYSYVDEKEDKVELTQNFINPPYPLFLPFFLCFPSLSLKKYIHFLRSYFQANGKLEFGNLAFLFLAVSLYFNSSHNCYNLAAKSRMLHRNRTNNTIKIILMDFLRGKLYGRHNG